MAEPVMSGLMRAPVHAGKLTTSMKLIDAEGGLQQSEFWDNRERIERSRSYGLSTSCIAAIHQLLDHGSSFDEVLMTIESAISRSENMHESATGLQMVAELMNRWCAASTSYNRQIMGQAAKFSERALELFETKLEGAGGSSPGLAGDGLGGAARKEVFAGTAKERFAALTFKAMNFSTVGALGGSDEISMKEAFQVAWGAKEAMSRMAETAEESNSGWFGQVSFVHGIWLHCQARALETQASQKNPAGGSDCIETLYREALQLFLDAYAKFSESYGPHNAYTVKAITMISREYHVTGNLLEAVTWGRLEVEAREYTFGKSDPRTRRAITSLNEIITARQLEVTFSETLAEKAVKLSDDEMVKSYDFDEVLIDVKEITWQLDPFGVPEPKRVDAVFRMIEALHGFETLKLKKETLLKFIYAVRRSYQTNSFHNWVHAWSTAHAAFLIVSSTQAGALLGPFGRVACYLTMLVHDLEHPGVNSQFLIASASPLALEFAAPNVLENMHWARAKALLRKGADTDILECLSDENRETVLVYMHTGIMATDMMKHKGIVGELEERANRATEGEEAYDGQCEEDRLEIIRAVCHSADLSAQGMTKGTAYAFGRGIFEEFYNQVICEKDENLEESVFMQNLDQPLAQAKAQLGFTHYVVTPLWSNLSTVFPELQQYMDRIEDRAAEIDFNNVQSWEGLHQGLIEGKRVSMTGMRRTNSKQKFDGEDGGEDQTPLQM